MQIVMLVGGKGTRLEPLTKGKIPKPMIDVEGKPFLESLIMHFKKQGFHDFILCTGHLGEIIKNHFGDGSRFGIKIRYSIEDEPLGSGGAIKNAEHLLDDNFLLINGDDYFEMSLSDFSEFHRNKNVMATLALRKTTKLGVCHAVALSGNGEVNEYHARNYNERSNADTTGYFALKKSILKDIPANKFVSLEHDIFPKLAGQGQLYGYFKDAEFFDIGTPEGYNNFVEWFKNPQP